MFDGVVTLYMPSRKTWISPMIEPFGPLQRIGRDRDRLRAGAAAVEDDVERFELVARGFERGARGGAGGVARTNLLRVARCVHTDCANAEEEAATAQPATRVTRMFLCIGAPQSSRHAERAGE